MSVQTGGGAVVGWQGSHNCDLGAIWGLRFGDGPERD